jgi:PleD family two-component response regulator
MAERSNVSRAVSIVEPASFDGYEPFWKGVPQMTVARISAGPSIKPRVLVVDDAREITDLVADWLRGTYEVIAAVSGRQAFELAHQLTPAAMLVDIVLPDVNGFQVAEALRQHPRLARTPIIFMSGLQHPENAVRAVELGAVDFLQKPLVEEVVRDRIRSALEMRT